MCVACLDYVKGSLNVKEFVRNFDEIDPVGVAELHPEIEKVFDKLWKDASKLVDIDALD